MTRIEHHGARIDLPGEWQPVPSDEPGELVHTEVDGPGTVTIMLLSVRPMFAIADQTRLLQDYAKHRSDFERGRNLSLEPTAARVEETEHGIEAHWGGLDVPGGLQQRHRAIMRKSVLADFCYSTTGLTWEEFDERATPALATASLSVEAAG